MPTDFICKKQKKNVFRMSIEPLSLMFCYAMLNCRRKKQRKKKVDKAHRIRARWGWGRKFLPPNKSNNKKTKNKMLYAITRQMPPSKRETDTCMFNWRCCGEEKLHVREKKPEEYFFCFFGVRKGGKVQARCYVVFQLYHFFGSSSASHRRQLAPGPATTPPSSKFPSIFHSFLPHLQSSEWSLALQAHAPARGRSSNETKGPSLLLRTTSCSSAPKDSQTVVEFPTCILFLPLLLFLLISSSFG